MLRYVIALPILISLAGCSRERPRQTARTGSAPQAQNAPTVPAPAFSGARAFDFLLKQTSFGPRNPNSAGHRACLSYLSQTLQGLADSLALQTFLQQGYHGEELRLTNVIASFRPAASARILLCAHWDTRPRADQDTNAKRRNEPILGANDGASGVAVLLEIASILKQQPPPVGVDIVLFDGEDYGMEGDLGNYFLGSRYFARTKPASYVPRFGILLDMVGDTYLELPKEGNSVRLAPDVVSLVWNTAARLGITQFVDAPGEEVSDDHLPLNDVGIKTIDVIDFDYPDHTNRYWHTLEDTPDHCSAESLQAVGTVLLHVLFDQPS